MFNSKHRRPMTQAEIDRSIMIQSSRIKKDFDARLLGKDDEMTIMIDSLIKLKNTKSKTHRTKSVTGHSQIKVVNNFEKMAYNEGPLQTAEVGVAASSKDIDQAFCQFINKNCSGDQINETMKPVTKEKKLKELPKQWKKGTIQQISRNQVLEKQARYKNTGKLKDPKIESNRAKVPKRQINSNKQLILTSQSTRPQIPNSKRLIPEPTKPKKILHKKPRLSQFSATRQSLQSMRVQRQFKHAMPNTRRRRFSVQNDIAGRPPPKIQNDLSSRVDSNNDLKMTLTGIVTSKSCKSKHKVAANSSKNTPPLEILTECDSAVSIIPPEVKTVPIRADKDITASSSTIDLEGMPDSEDSTVIENQPIESRKRRDPRQMTRDRTPLRRDKHPRQHRIKVRSPKRRMVILEQAKPTDTHNNFSNNQNTGTTAINWDEEFEIYSSENVTNVVETAEDEDRPSTHSLDDMCRICHGGDGLITELGRLISACSCRGTVGRVHVKCLERWLTESGKSRCELCGTRYATRRVHRYGVPRALIMWILSQNAKQLMVDSLGIMLMSPLAVLAAWLSGRTLAGLMTQESHVTPWPLASTFVLACMTLVCYYCWIVSAATRHALGWWIWYRSQYEVRLQLQDNEE